MAYYSRNRIESVAGAISELRYQEMLDLGQVLADMANDRSVDGQFDIAADAIANLLADWATTVEDEIDAAKQKESE